MPGRYASIRLHLIWSTKHRQPVIDAYWRPRLFGVMEHAVDRRGGTLLCAGGVRDHVHLYVECPTTLTVADLVTSIKSASAKWIRSTITDLRGFEWQSGYAAFSVNPMDDRELRDYIRSQELHHRERDFSAEFTSLLIGHGITFESRHTLD